MKAVTLGISGRSVELGLVSLLSIVASSCGSNPTPLPTTVTSGQTQSPIANCIPGSWGCTTTSNQTWSQNNFSCTQQNNVTSNGVSLKKFLCYPLLTPSGGLFLNTAPQLGPDDPSNYRAYSTNTQVKPGDRIVFSGSGGYYTSSSSFQFSFNWSSKCRENSLSGPAPQGLYASDGSAVYFLGAGATHTVQNQGQLRIGFNYDGVPKASCANLTVSNFVVHHCEDAAGTTYPCP